MTFLALDFETTGLDAGTGRVVEVGAIRFRLKGGDCLEEACMAALVDPCMPMPARAISIHGIRDEDLEGAPTFGEVAPSLLALAEGAAIVAHNARFDLSFLDAELARLGMSRPPSAAHDTVHLSRRAFPGRASYRLGAIASALGIDSGLAHRALDDARTCMRLYAACARQLRRSAKERRCNTGS